MQNIYGHMPIRIDQMLKYLKNGPSPASFSFIFVFCNNSTIFTTNKCKKNVHPVYSAEIRTHYLWNMSLLP